MNDFTQTPLDILLKNCKTRVYPKGQIILYEGQSPSDIFVLKTGAVKIYDIDIHGNEKIIHILRPPAIFPAVFFFGNTGQSNTFYTTIVESVLFVMPLREFEEKITQQPELGVYCVRWFAKEVMELFQRLSSLEKTSTRDKLHAALHYLIRQHATKQKNGWYRVTFPISHQLLADLIGVTRESTTVVMKDLQREKIISQPRLSVLDINPVTLGN